MGWSLYMWDPYKDPTQPAGSWYFEDMKDRTPGDAHTNKFQQMKPPNL